MKRVILTGAGGRLGVVHARAIKAADPSVYLIGVDADPYRIHRATTDEVHLVPRSSDSDFIPVLSRVVADTKADLVLTNVTADIPVISANRDRIGCMTFLPEHSTVELCEDKARSNAVWQDAGVAVPRSMLLKEREDLRRAFEEYSGQIWLRAISGSGATGALPASDVATAEQWVEFNSGWGRFMAAERLGSQTVSWESIWSDGELIVAQARKRLFWEFGRIAMSGVSGIAGAGEAVNDPVIDDLGTRAVRAVAKRPNGVLGVDIAYDYDGNPKVTEINAGRFMSGGVCHFATALFNIPALAIKVAFGEDPGVKTPLLNPLTEGTVFVSGLDREPVLITSADVERMEQGLAKRRGQ